MFSAGKLSNCGCMGRGLTLSNPRSPQALRAIAQRWGSVVGFVYTEAFELARFIGGPLQF